MGRTGVRTPDGYASGESGMDMFIRIHVQSGWESSMQCYQCLECAYIYDPAKGDPTQNIPPGTPFEKLPPTWRCPECKISIQKHGVFRVLSE